MFENIQFLNYEIFNPVTPKTLILESIPADKSEYFAQEGKLPPKNMINADYHISGKLETFRRPLVSDWTIKNLYHMESFSIFHCDKDFYTRRQDYESYLILFTYGGKGCLEYEGETYLLKPGDGFFIECRRPHFYRSEGTGWLHSVLHLNGPLLNNLFKVFYRKHHVIFTQSMDGPYQTALENILRQYSSPQPIRDWLVSDQLSQLLTNNFISANGEESTQGLIPEHIRQLMNYMEQHFDSHIDLDYLSDYVGFSKYHLSREYKKYTGYTPNEYLIRLRIDHAKSLLVTTTLPVKKIAYLVGINDMNNFTNLFRKRTGVTPTNYRRR